MVSRDTGWRFSGQFAFLVSLTQMLHQLDCVDAAGRSRRGNAVPKCTETLSYCAVLIRGSDPFHLG